MEHTIGQYLRALDTISRLAPLLADRLEPGRGNPQDAFKAPTRPTSKPPCNLTWLDLQIQVENLLRWACRQAWDDLPGKRTPPPSRLKGMATWLADRADHLTTVMWLDSETWWNIQTGQEGSSLAAETIHYARLLEETLDPPMQDIPARTAPELAIILGINPDRIRQWKARGKLQPIGRRGNANLYPVDAVTKLAEQNTSAV